MCVCVGGGVTFINLHQKWSFGIWCLHQNWYFRVWCLLPRTQDEALLVFVSFEITWEHAERWRVLLARVNFKRMGLQSSFNLSAYCDVSLAECPDAAEPVLQQWHEPPWRNLLQHPRASNHTSDHHRCSLSCLVSFVWRQEFISETPVGAYEMHTHTQCGSELASRNRQLQCLIKLRPCGAMKGYYMLFVIKCNRVKMNVHACT